jgi:hypothetical protein
MQMMKKPQIVLLLLGVFAAPAFAQRFTVFPEFLSGGEWTTEVFFANQGLSEVPGITVSFYDQAGAPLSVESNLGVGADFVFSLNPGSTQVIKVTPTDTLEVGYILVRYPSNGSPVRATEIFRDEQGGTVLAEVSVSQQEYGDHFSFPVEIDSSKGIYTALALINPTAYIASAQTIIVNLIRPDGSIQANAMVPMQAGQHLAGYLDQAWLFPGLDNFTGSVSISSPFGVGVLALRQDRQAFGELSTNGGPILGPFALNGVAVQEKEPNDADAEATPINGSQIISGTIGAVGDLDFFKFTGKAGAIISVICNAQGMGSYLDSVLEIYDSNLKMIAQNDQNGLSPQGYPINDSFIQMVLPADGTYYIVVTDYYGNGGPNFTYTLHVKLP